MNSNIKILIAFVLTCLAIFFGWYFKSIIVYIIISAVLSFMGRPLINILGKIKIPGFTLFHKIKIKSCRLAESLKAALTLLTLWFIFIGFFRLIVPLISEEAKEFSKLDVASAMEQLQEPISKIEAFAKKIAVEQDFDLQKEMSEKVYSVIKISKLGNIFGSIASTLTDLLIAFFSISFITFFFLKDSSLFLKMLLIIVPDKHGKATSKTLESIQNLLVRYFIGILIEVMLVMLLNIIGHSLFVGIEFKHAVIIGLLAGLMNVIPYIGPIIGTIIGLLIGIAINIEMDFYTEMLPTLGYMTIVFMSIQLLDNIVFQPLIYGNSVHAHPLEVFIVIMAAGSLAGIPGMVLAIPAYTVLRVVAKEFFSKYSVVSKITQSLD
jgi:predicted PurR-regulated permease PerM